MRNISINLDDDNELSQISYALDSTIRRKILKLVAIQSYSILQISQILNLALSTTSFHIKILKDAKLIKLLPSPNRNGNEKNVSQALTNIQIVLGTADGITNNLYSLSIPLGSYSSFNIVNPCGLIDSSGQPLFELDQPSLFFAPNRFNAQLLFFYKGYVEYTIPSYPIYNKEVESIFFSLELCAECPNYNNHWKSDITFWLNDIEICTYFCQGDYGDRRGFLTPENWPSNSTQYGFLKKIKVSHEGTFLDEVLVSNVKIDDLKLNETNICTLKIGIKNTAKHIGGINIFGKGFGDTPQDIIFQITMK